VQIRFKTRKLEKQYANHKEAEKAYGRDVARKFIDRVNIIKATKDIETLQTLPVLRCHPLIGNRKGQWSINLSGFYRLIFTLEGEALEIACLEEVSKHYDQ
jgi:proteic killer suppression protein